MMRLFHGTKIEVRTPKISYSRRDVDFGRGFYTTEDEVMAKKWACNKHTSVVNEYEFEMDGLSVLRLTADERWLGYCSANRNEEKLPFDDTQYDVIIGPTADDKLFSTLDMYADGLLSVTEAISVVNCMNYSSQVVIKKQEIIEDCLRFVTSRTLYGAEKEHYIHLFQRDRREANQKTEEMIRGFKRT